MRGSIAASKFALGNVCPTKYYVRVFTARTFAIGMLSPDNARKHTSTGEGDAVCQVAFEIPNEVLYDTGMSSSERLT